mgnify:FL=1
MSKPIMVVGGYGDDVPGDESRLMKTFGGDGTIIETVGGRVKGWIELEIEVLKKGTSTNFHLGEKLTDVVITIMQLSGVLGILDKTKGYIAGLKRQSFLRKDEFALYFDPEKMHDLFVTTKKDELASVIPPKCEYLGKSYAISSFTEFAKYLDEIKNDCIELEQYFESISKKIFEEMYG